ncbi:response regulator transcription factor [Salmonella enterica]|nr:response regulator transcription factor [Salmonella enterica]
MATILLVDDHPAICFAVKVAFEKQTNFHVTTSNGERLLQQIHRDNPDLLLLDLELNGSDGLDRLPRIKQHFPTLKILIYTNQPAAHYARRTLLAGADGFVNKSLDLDDLMSSCGLILAGYHCFPKEVMETLLNSERQPQSADSLLSRLSDRELTVLHYLKRGKTNKQIADSLLLSNKTISTYKIRMIKKCGVERIEQLYDLLDGESE